MNNKKPRIFLNSRLFVIVPIGGSNISVQAAGFTEDGSVDHGASWRFVADLQDLSSAHHIVGI